MESASTNLRSIMEEEEEEEEEEETKQHSTLGSGKVSWKQDLRSIREMEDKENIPKFPDNISDLPPCEMRTSQSIKRTKNKGFNLRKSLAWNPAFFTEEGVLDPNELSYICGSNSESNRSTNSSNRQILNDVTKKSYSKSQMKSEFRCHSGRKLFTTPEPSRRQDKIAAEGTRKLKQSEPSTKKLLRPPTTSQQTRVISMKTTCNEAKLQRFMQGNTTPTSQVSRNQENVARAVKGENSKGPRRIQSIEEKESVFPPKSSSVQSSTASQMGLQTIPKPPINASLAIKPSALRKPSPSFGFFAQGNLAAQSGCSSQKSTEKTLTSIPSSLPKAPPFKCRPPIGHDSATKVKTGTIPQSKIPQRMRFDRPVVNTPGKKRAEKSTRTAVEPREKSVASKISCNHFPPETYLTKDRDTNIDKPKVRITEGKSTKVSVEVKESVIIQMTRHPVSSKTCNSMDVHVTLIESDNAVPTDDSSKHNQYDNSGRAFIETEEPHAIQQKSNSIAIAARSPIKENATVSKSDDISSNATYDGAKHMEEDSRTCQGREEAVTTPLQQNSTLPETCSLMDVDAIITNSSDFVSKVDSNGKKRTLNSSEGQKEEAVVIPSTCNHIPPETCSSKDKHTTRHDLNLNGSARCNTAKVSVSPLRTQGCNADFSPCKEKPVEKRCKLDQGSSLPKRENESFEREMHEAGTVQGEVAAESSEGRIIPNFRQDLVPFSEEWLAALEAYGEEILVKKTGPVQNSPPDKSIPEPSPWSPVKKKAQDIGPYDCTKYSKTTPPSAQ